MGNQPQSQEKMKQKSKNQAHQASRGGSNPPPKTGRKGTSRGATPAGSDRSKDRDSRAPRGTPHEGENRKPERAAPRIKINVFGFHAVEAALFNPNRTIHKIYATDATEDQVCRLVIEANKKGFDHPEPTILVDQTFDRALTKGTVHQGIGIDSDPLQDVFLPDIINKTAAQEKSVIVLLDQVTDPHNLGAVIRSACAFGADAIIVQSRNAPELSGIVAKTASGAMEHLPVLYETNLARAIESLQEHGYFAIALDERGEKTIGEAPKYQKTILVLGAEGPGLRPLVREKCDLLVKLPTAGALSSLNVSNAAAVALYAVLN